MKAFFRPQTRRHHLAIRFGGGRTSVALVAVRKMACSKGDPMAGIRPEFLSAGRRGAFRTKDGLDWEA
jgi:hypothetical protein